MTLSIVGSWDLGRMLSEMEYEEEAEYCMTYGLKALIHNNKGMWCSSLHFMKLCGICPDNKVL